MNHAQAYCMAGAFAIFLGLVYVFLMTNPVVMTVLLVVVGLAAGRYVVVESHRQYKLMQALTEE